MLNKMQHGADIPVWPAVQHEVVNLQRKLLRVAIKCHKENKFEKQIFMCIDFLGLPYQITTGWVAETRELYSLEVLKAGSPRSRC